ncbi:MAG: hypothetical protein GF384_02900 [Elusimicrobia bacterium]|nr:hypothetical protein [Elusimicrobiota bacterium]MBD3411898.1 hypothetical protein [Elusimicrobiota bacterium]
MVSLNTVREGKKIKIIQIDAGCGLSRRLNGMGLFVGDTVRVIQNSLGPVIIAKGDLRLALGRGMSHKIIVEEQ